MARRTHIEIIDDIDGTEAAGSVDFALDGVKYTIDLSEDNAEKLRSDFAPWIEKATERSSKKSARTETQKIRAWAKENGIEIRDRGRISAEIVEAYYLA